MRAATVILAAGALALLPAAPAAAKRVPSYHSPGYKGTTKLPNVAPAPIAPITLGAGGKLPSVLVDAAGTGHVLFAQDGGDSPDQVAYCRLARGQKACASTSALAPNAPAGGASGAFEGNFPGGNHDTDGPIPIVQGNQLYLVDRRFPDAFTQPDGKTGESNVFLWASQDGGQTFSGPAIIGDNQMGGGAIAYGGEDNPSIGTISRTQTGGTFFQGAGAGQFTRAKAQLGTGDQAYDGGLADDGVLPVAVFDDLTPTTYVREWSGSGNVNDPATWSTASFPGASPRIAGGPIGVFVLYRDQLVGGNVLVRRIVAGQPSGNPVKLAGNVQNATIAEDAAGGLAAAWVDAAGVELRTSSDGVTWTPAQLIAPTPPGGTIGDLALAATSDGGGFATYIQNPAGAEGVGTVATSVFGTQRATGKPGLGQLPGGGLGSQIGDQLATTTCSEAKFGVVTARVGAGCFAHDKNDPNLDVSLGEVNVNGISIIPDAGVKIGIDPKLHTIDTTGSVSVVLKGQGLNVTLWHGELHAKIPVAQPGYDLFDFNELKPPDVAGFPIDGDVDVKLISGGVQVPVSLKLPGVFGGVTGSATLSATLDGGLNLDSLEFKVGDASFGAAELKDLDISYTRSGNVWKGSGTLNVPTGGTLFSLSLAIEFDDGNYKSGSFVVGIPYPGIPLDLNDTPPQLYLTKGGLGFGLSPLSLSGSIEFGITPLSEGDYAFRLDGGLTASFGNPVALTATATGFLYKIQVADAKLVYTLPSSVVLDAESSYDLGVVEEKGKLHAVIDPHSNTFGGRISSDLVIHLAKLGLSSALPSNVLDGGDVTVPGEDIAINTKGFGVYIPFGSGVPFVGTITYDWGAPAPVPHAFVDVTSDYAVGVASTSAAGAHAHAAAGEAFQVPAGAPAVAVDVTGDGGAPDVVLTAPNGTQVVPSTTVTAGTSVVAFGDPTVNTTHVGVKNPAAGRWTVSQAPGSAVAITGLKYVVGEAPPKVSASVGGHGATRTLTYHVKAPKNVTVAFAEQTGKLFHRLGAAKGSSGTLRFTPAVGAAGKRSIVALIDNGGLPHGRPIVASYVAPAPATPTRASRLRVSAGAKAFSVSFTAPRSALHTLVTIVATDGRHLQKVLPVRTHTLSVPVIGFKDGIRVSVAGVSATGRRGPAVSASARRAR
ncbi:MAG TPA: hypothetical protein VII98_09060 [Solirubrobacteraceae bacterium]